MTPMQWLYIWTALLVVWIGVGAWIAGFARVDSNRVLLTWTLLALPLFLAFCYIITLRG